MNRKVCLHMDVIHPTPKHSQKRNMVVEKEFNQHHEAVKHIYTGDNLYLLKTTAMAKKNEFKDAFYIVRGMSYDVDIESTVWV